MEAYMPAIAGGLMIGGAAAILLVTLGRIAGVSGIFWSAITGGIQGKLRDNAWRLAFVAGLILGPLAVHKLFGLATPGAPQGSVVLAILAGVFVGFGTRLGSGCTSGHGICGIARWSPRSFIATATFMLAGFITVFVVRHILN